MFRVIVKSQNGERIFLMYNLRGSEAQLLMHLFSNQRMSVSNEQKFISVSVS